MGEGNEHLMAPNPGESAGSPRGGCVQAAFRRQPASPAVGAGQEPEAHGLDSALALVPRVILHSH